MIVTTIMIINLTVLLLILLLLRISVISERPAKGFRENVYRFLRGLVLQMTIAMEEGTGNCCPENAMVVQQ